MLTKDIILNFLNENKKKFRTNFRVIKLGLFGSFSRDEQNEDSDIDILIELEENTPDIFEMKQELRKYIKKNLKREVDICREKYLKHYVKKSILKEALYV